MNRVITPAKQTFAPLQNYYGGVSVFAHEGQHFLAMGNVSASSCIEVSEAFYNAFTAEFEALRVGFLDQDVEYTVSIDTPVPWQDYVISDE